MARKPVTAVACAFILAIMAAFRQATTNSVVEQMLYCTIVAVGVVAVGASAAWLLSTRPLSAGPASEVAEAMRMRVGLCDPSALQSVRQDHLKR